MAPAKAILTAGSQLVSSLSNFLVLFGVARHQAPRATALIVLGLAVFYAFQAVARASCGEPRVALSRDGATVTGGSAKLLGLLSVGLAAAEALLAASFQSSQLLLVACAAPAALVGDHVRYLAFERDQPSHALATDTAWLMLQVAILVCVASAPGAVIGWGVGAAAAAVIGLILSPRSSWAGDLVLYLRETRGLAEWLASQVVLGQVVGQLVPFALAAAIGRADLARLRTAQTLLMPLGTLISAAAVVFMRRYANRGTKTMTRDTLLLFGAALPAAALLTTAAPWLLEVSFGDAYRVTGLVIAPIAALTCLQVVAQPLAAALRVQRQGRTVFVSQVIGTLIGVPIVIGLAIGFDLTGAATGLLLQFGLTLGTSAWLWHRHKERAHAAVT